MGESKISHLDDARGHKISEVVCLECRTRWVSVRPIETRLTALECPGCGGHECVIETGESII